MANLSNLVIEHLKQSPDQGFTARQLAKAIIVQNETVDEVWNQ